MLITNDGKTIVISILKITLIRSCALKVDFDRRRLRKVDFVCFLVSYTKKKKK